MGSEIVEMRAKYGHYTDRLPEEILQDGIKEDLEKTRAGMLSIIDKDREFIFSLIAKSKKHVYLNKMETSHAYLIKKAFPYDHEIESVKESSVNYLLAHWLLAKLSLSRISQMMIGELENVRDMNLQYEQAPAGAYERRLAYIRFTRAYEAFLGCAVNILDIIQEYIDVFNQACKQLDPSYRFEGGTVTSALHDDEIFFGVYEVLLRANMGRFSCVPLIRSGLEVQLARRVLSPPETGRYKGKWIEAVKGFDIMKFLGKYSGRLGISYEIIDLDSIDRLYDWGSIAHHRGYRMAHSEMWYATNIAENVLALVKIDPAKFNANFDDVIEQLVLDHAVHVH